MLIARDKRKTNIAEYILYMWQVEDLLRSCNFDSAKINELVVSQFKVDDVLRSEISDWYNNLASAMQMEQIQEKGHLQTTINLMNDLNEFHLKLLITQRDAEYVRMYQFNQEAISAFQQKSGSQVKNEVEACLNALYGYLLLKLRKSEITLDTQKSIGGFAQLLGHLSARYIQFENDEFEL